MCTTTAFSQHLSNAGHPHPTEQSTNKLVLSIENEKRENFGRAYSFSNKCKLMHILAN